MKIIMSRNVMLESQIAGHRICETFNLPHHDLSIDEQMSALEDAAVNLANVRFEVVGEELHYTIDDKVVIATLRLYAKFAGYIKALVDIAKPLCKALQCEAEEITTLALEVRK